MNRKIQIIRAISAFAVVIIHINASGFLAVLDRPFINFCVAMFTFISGYLTNTTINDITLFYKKRILKVLVPYVIWTIVYCVALGRMGSVVKYLITGSASAPLYYILVYIQLVILTPIIGKLIQSKYEMIGWLITPAYILLTRYMGNVVRLPVSAQTVCLAWFIYYYLGMKLGNRKVKLNLNQNKLFVLYVIAIVFSIGEGALWFYWFDNFDMATTQLRISSIATSISACFIAYTYINNGIDVQLNKINRLLISVGNCSFGIFFSHILINGIIGRISALLRWERFLDFPIKTILVFCIAYVLSFSGKKILGKFAWLLGL